VTDSNKDTKEFITAVKSFMIEAHEWSIETAEVDQLRYFGLV
jgi:hypothetical protein